MLGGTFRQGSGKMPDGCLLECLPLQCVGEEETVSERRGRGCQKGSRIDVRKLRESVARVIGLWAIVVFGPFRLVCGIQGTVFPGPIQQYGGPRQRWERGPSCPSGGSLPMDYDCLAPAPYGHSGVSPCCDSGEGDV